LRKIQYLSLKFLGFLFVGTSLGYCYTKAANPVIDQQDWAIMLFTILLQPLFEVVAVELWVWVSVVLIPTIALVILKHSMESIKKFLSETRAAWAPKK